MPDARPAPLAEAATQHTAVQGHLKLAAAGMRKHQHPVAKQLAQHLDRLRTGLRLGYGALAPLLDPDQDGDDDRTPQGDTDHDVFASDRGSLAGLLLAEAASILRQDDTYDARRQLVNQALCTDPKLRVDDGDADDTDPQGAPCGPYVVDLFDDVVVYQYGDDLYRVRYTLSADEETVTFGTPDPVERAYVPVAEAATPLDESSLSQAQRDALPASAFGDPAHRLFPIKDQDDVDSAARLIGKAHDPEAVKTRILAIAKRLGLKAPAAWTEAAQESAPLAEEAVLLEASELCEFTPWEVLT